VFQLTKNEAANGAVDYNDAMPYVVYIMKCADGSLYTGITTDLKRRFREHKDGRGGAYTHSHRVIKIVYTEPCQTKSRALKREAEIKGWRRDKKLALVRS